MSSQPGDGRVWTKGKESGNGRGWSEGGGLPGQTTKNSAVCAKNDASSTDRRTDACCEYGEFIFCCPLLSFSCVCVCVRFCSLHIFRELSESCSYFMAIFCSPWQCQYVLFCSSGIVAVAPLLLPACVCRVCFVSILLFFVRFVLLA